MKEFNKLISSYLTASIVDRIKLQNKTDIIFKQNIIELSQYYAEKAVINNEEQWIKYGIAANSLENVRVDLRYNLMGLSLLLDASKRLSIDKTDLLRLIKEVALEPFKTLSIDFLNRNERDQSIGSMGFKIGNCKEFKYKKR